MSRNFERFGNTFSTPASTRTGSSLDLSLVRGMDYYTGPIFEAVDLEDGIGSIGAGGRYDRLIGAFSGQDAPAVGISLGLERIVDLLETRVDGSGRQGSETQVLVTVFSPDLLPSSLRLATQLRKAGFKVEMYLNHGPTAQPAPVRQSQGNPILHHSWSR